MKLLFLGDSITEGNPGVSYVDIIRKRTSVTCENRGVGGDTVSSLLKRVKKMSDLNEFDYIILFIGVNDIYGKITLAYKILKLLKGQNAAKDTTAFENIYSELLEYLVKQNNNIIVIPPLLIGEDYKNSYNIELKKIIDIEKRLAMQYHVVYEDVYSVFRRYLKRKEVSAYLPNKLFKVYKDTRINKRSKIDEKSKRRGLHLTIDGVHMNSYGAMLISKCIIKRLN